MRATEQQISHAAQFVVMRNRPSVAAIQQYMKLPTGISREIYDELVNRGVIKV